MCGPACRRSVRGLIPRFLAAGWQPRRSDTGTILAGSEHAEHQDIARRVVAAGVRLNAIEHPVSLHRSFAHALVVADREADRVARQVADRLCDRPAARPGTRT